MALRFPPRKLLLVLVAGFVAVLAAYLPFSSTPGRAATAPVLDFPQATCSGSTANINFTWQPADRADEVWLDVSSGDTGFAPGTFTGYGPFSNVAASYPVAGLEANKVYVVRVNARSGAEWHPSAAVAFVPCGAPALISSSQSCAGIETTTASFRWAPSSPPGVAQIVEAGPDQIFRDGTARSSGRLTPQVSSYDMTGLRSDVTNYFRITTEQADGSLDRSVVMYFATSCAAGGGGNELVHTGDRLVYNRLGIDAPVNTRRVLSDGALGDPEGKDDVVLYDFSAFSGVGGAPGKGGTSIIAGHLDYRPNFEGVFWDLAKAQPGDRIEYVSEDGSRHVYVVSWVSLVPSQDYLNEFFVSTTPETMILITCEGTFDTVARNYSDRVLVYAVAVQ